MTRLLPPERFGDGESDGGMDRSELLEFAGKLVGHLAGVLAAQNGYVEGLCPDCNTTRGPLRRRAHVSLAGPCETCEDRHRVWSKTTAGRLRRMSDRQIIEVFAGEP